MHLRRVSIFSDHSISPTMRDKIKPTLFLSDLYTDDTFCLLCMNNDPTPIKGSRMYWKATMWTTNTHKIHRFPIRRSIGFLNGWPKKTGHKLLLELNQILPLRQCNSRHIADRMHHLGSKEFIWFRLIYISGRTPWYVNNTVSTTANPFEINSPKNIMEMNTTTTTNIFNWTLPKNYLEGTLQFAFAMIGRMYSIHTWSGWHYFINVTYGYSLEFPSTISSHLLLRQPKDYIQHKEQFSESALFLKF